MVATRPRYCGVLLVAALGLNGLVVCPPALAADKRASHKPPPPPYSAIFPAEQAWLITLPAPPAAGPAQDGRRVFVPLTSSEFVALSRETGETVWTASVAGTVAPVARDGLVFLATTDGVRAFDAATGAARWTTPLAEPIAVLEVGSDRLFGAGASTAVALDAATGRVIWQHPLGDASPPAGLAVADDSLFISFASGRLVGLATADGSSRWQRSLEGALTQPAVAHGRVYVGSTQNRLFALNARTGKDNWTWRAGGDVVGSAADGKLLYYAALDTIIRGVNPGNGNQQWKHDIGTRPVVPPIVLDGSVLVAGLAPTLSAFTPATGVPLGTYDAPGRLFGSPLVAAVPTPRDVSIVLVLRDGRAIGLRSLALLFNESARQPFSALPGKTLTRERLP